MPDVKNEKSIGELCADLARDTSALMRQEVALARAEIGGSAKKLAPNLMSLGIGGAVGFAALLAIVAAAIIALANWLPWAAAALVVGIALGIAAALLVSKALTALRTVDFTPRQTVETLKEDARWAKEQMK